MLLSMRRTLLSVIVGLTLISCSDGDAVTGVRSSTLTMSVLTAETVRSLVVRVSGPGIDSAAVSNLAIATNGIATGTLTIPAGSGRRIELSAFDVFGVLTHSGDTTLTLVAGANPTLNLTLTPKYGSLGVVGRFAGAQVSVQDSSVRRIPVGDTVRIVAQGTDATGASVLANELIWGSSNPAIMTVSGGLVRAHRVGSAVLSVGYRGASVRLNVEVSPDPLAVRYLYFNGAEVAPDTLASGLTRVTAAQMSTTAGTSIAPPTGSYAWWFGAGATSVPSDGSGVNRDLFLTVPATTHADIDAGRIVSVVSFDWYKGEPTALFGVDVSYHSSTNLAFDLGVSSVEHWLPGTWRTDSTVRVLPAGTRFIRVNLYLGCWAQPAGCSYTARRAFFDDISIVLRDAP